MAQPVTLTGSIGVWSAAFNIEKLLDKIGVSWNVVRAGDRSDFASLYRGMTEAEKQIFSDFIVDIYERFLEVVSEGRDMDTEDVHAIAQGRVWTGSQAFDRGLVDALGGWDTALDTMKEKLGVVGDIELVDFSPALPTLDLFAAIVSQYLGDFDAYSRPEALDEVTETVRRILSARDEYAYYLMPYTFTGVE